MLKLNDYLTIQAIRANVISGCDKLATYRRLLKQVSKQELRNQINQIKVGN